MSFIRKYQIIFGATYTIVDQNKATGTSVYDAYKVNGQFVNTTDLDDYLAENQNAFYELEGDIREDVTGYNIEFDIIKNAKKSRNKTSTLVIYNLSDVIVNYLKNNSANNVVMSIKAGYNDEGMTLLFKGTVGQVVDVWEGATRKTTMKLKDGDLNLKEAFTYQCYKKGSKVDDIISSILTDFGLPKNTGLIASLGDDEVISKPYYFSGLAIHAINDWANKYGFNFSIQNGAVCLMPFDGRAENAVYVIDEDSGLIGNIVPKNENTTTLSLDTKTKGTIYKMKVLLNGGITPECTIKVNSGDFSNVFMKVVSVEHKGGYESGEWATELEAKVVDNIVTVGEAYTRE